MRSSLPCLAGSSQQLWRWSGCPGPRRLLPSSRRFRLQASDESTLKSLLDNDHNDPLFTHRHLHDIVCIPGFDYPCTPFLIPLTSRGTVHKTLQPAYKNPPGRPPLFNVQSARVRREPAKSDCGRGTYPPGDPLLLVSTGSCGRRRCSSHTASPLRPQRSRALPRP